MDLIYKQISRILMPLNHLVLSSVGLMFLTPFVWMIFTSLKRNSQLYGSTAYWFPNPVEWNNYLDAINRMAFFPLFENTLIIALISALGVMIISPQVAYSLAKLRWRGRSIIFAATIGVMMVPSQMTMVPEFILMHNLGFVGTWVPLFIKPVLGVPIYIFLLRQFFVRIPAELLQTARMDGAGEVRMYWEIMLPQALPAVCTVGLFQIVASWQEFQAPLLYLNDPSMYTLSLGLQQFQSETGTEWGQLMAASLLTILPLVILFFLLQKVFFQGLARQGIKG